MNLNAVISSSETPEEINLPVIISKVAWLFGDQSGTP